MLPMRLLVEYSRIFLTPSNSSQASTSCSSITEGDGESGIFGGDRGLCWAVVSGRTMRKASRPCWNHAYRGPEQLSTNFYET